MLSCLDRMTLLIRCACIYCIADHIQRKLHASHTREFHNTRYSSTTLCRCTACCGHVVSCIQKSRSAAIMNLYLWLGRGRTCEVGQTHVGTLNKCEMKISALNLAPSRARDAVCDSTSHHAPHSINRV